MPNFFGYLNYRDFLRDYFLKNIYFEKLMAYNSRNAGWLILHHQYEFYCHPEHPSTEAKVPLIAGSGFQGGARDSQPDVGVYDFRGLSTVAVEKGFKDR